MPLQHLQLLAVLKTDDVVGDDLLLDRHRWDKVPPFGHTIRDVELVSDLWIERMMVGRSAISAELWDR